MKVVLTTKYTEGGTQMRHVFYELEAQGLKPKMLFKNDHDEIIFEVPTEMKEWINVNDGLPKYDGEYYVTYERDGIRDTDVDYFRTNGKGWVYYNVIAWREKFSPYKGDEV